MGAIFDPVLGPTYGDVLAKRVLKQVPKARCGALPGHRRLCGSGRRAKCGRRPGELKTLQDPSVLLSNVMDFRPERLDVPRFSSIFGSLKGFSSSLALRRELHHPAHGHGRSGAQHGAARLARGHLGGDGAGLRADSELRGERRQGGPGGEGLERLPRGGGRQHRRVVDDARAVGACLGLTLKVKEVHN